MDYISVGSCTWGTLGSKLGARALGWVQVGFGYITLDPGAPTPPPE